MIWLQMQMGNVLDLPDTFEEELVKWAAIQ